MAQRKGGEQPNPANPVIRQILVLTTPRLKAGARAVGALAGGVGLTASEQSVILKVGRV